MVTLLEIARHPFSAWVAHRDEEIETAATECADRYARERSQRLAQLEAAGKCLARSGKHGNLRYWPSECGSRVLSEHRRRQRAFVRAKADVSDRHARIAAGVDA